MKENIKSIKLLNKAEFYENLNEKISLKNYNKFLKIFEEILKNNKWIDIPNKELWFNKDVMACYSKHKLLYKYNMSLKECLNNIKLEPKYNKYNIEWDIQTKKELVTSFWDNKNPLISSAYSEKLFYQKNNNIRTLSNLKDGNKILFPYFRLGKEEDYISFEQNKSKFPYTFSEILNIFLKEGLIPEEIYNNNDLKKKFEKLINDYKEKRLKYEIYLKNNELNEEKIIETVLKNENSDPMFNNISLEVTLNNGDVIEREYKNGIPEGTAVCYKNDSSIDFIEFQYKNGVIEGPGIIRYKNGVGGNMI